jgi:hypothetical protein
MHLTNLNRVKLGTLCDGSILIWSRKQDLEELDFFIREKSNECYLYLQERDSATGGFLKDFGK